MKSHAQKQSELICVVSMGLVGVTLVLAHAFAAFSPVFDGDYFEIENVGVRMPRENLDMD